MKTAVLGLAEARLTPSDVHCHTSTPRRSGDATATESMRQPGGARGPTPVAVRASQNGRVRRKTYADRLILKALVILIMHRLETADALLMGLDQDVPVALQRRRAVLPPHRPGLMGGFGRHLLAVLTPWTHHGRAAAVGGTPLHTSGGGWHQTHPEQGEMPQTLLDTAAGWLPSGWHGWWYGWNGLGPCRSGPSGCRWRRNGPRPRRPTIPAHPGCWRPCPRFEG